MTAWKQEVQTEKQPEAEILKKREGWKSPQNNKNVIWEIPAQREIKIPFSLARTPAKDYTEIKHRLKTRLSFYLQIALLKDSNFNFLF